LAKVQRLNKVQRSEVTNGSTVQRFKVGRVVGGIMTWAEGFKAMKVQGLKSM